MRSPFVGRARIYQLMVRHFGNKNETRVPNGSLEENGCGQFIDINAEALTQIKEMGFTHVWFTGVLEHASGTSYPSRPADPVGLLKGKAGSPYAVRDYYNVSPDLAMDPENRLQEFKDLLERCHEIGLRVLIDLIPNHVARSYQSSVFAEDSFGKHDQTDYIFHPENNFYYLASDKTGEGLRLPNGDQYEPEATNGRVTGNNAATWTPGENDWYETVKLNYGHDYTLGSDTRFLPGVDTPKDKVPRTWRGMEHIISYWLKMGVDGFRVDMAHMVPLEFWHWALNQARRTYEGAYFIAEAYNDDPAKLTSGNILEQLVEAGFDGIYDQPAYHTLKGIYEDGKWANDLADVDRNCTLHGKRVRYIENHDEVRLANPQHWGNHGAQIGIGAFAALALCGTDTLMVYNGQEFGEKGEGATGFSGDDGRTTIFDYWGVKSLQRWLNWGTFNGGFLRDEEKELREKYREILHLSQEKIFAEGLIYDLNEPNRHNPKFGHFEEMSVSGGHWIYGFLRHLPDEARTVLVVVNLHPSEAVPEVEVWVPKHARLWGKLERFTKSHTIENLKASSFQVLELPVKA